MTTAKSENLTPIKKSRLKAVEPKHAEPSKPKIAVFGKAGVGKTWTALDFPSVYYIDTEGGANREQYTKKLTASGGMYFGPEQGSQNFDNVISEVKTLATENHKFRTLALDSGSKLYDMTRQEAAESGGDDYGRDKKEANKPARRLMNWLQRIDMNVIIICHEIPLWGLDGKGERTQVGVTFDAWAKLDYDLDLVLNIQKAGPRRFAKVTKSRLQEFPEADTFDWSYAEFAKRYGQEIIEKESRELVLVTPEQMARYKTLLELWKAPEGQEDRWLKAAGASVLEEMDTDKMAKIITYIEKQLKGEK